MASSPRALSRLVVAVVLFNSCASLPAEPSASASPIGPQRAPFRIVLGGDGTRAALAVRIAASARPSVQGDFQKTTLDLDKGVTLVTIPPDADSGSATFIALIKSADLLVLATDESTGPMPIHKESLLLARDSSVPTAAFVFTSAGRVTDAEIFELMELEVRELLTKYRFRIGDDLIFADSPAAATKLPRGIPILIEKLRMLAKKPSTSK